jgi:hypothetical protein
MSMREMRKEYRIRPKVVFEVDKRDFLFFFLPTIIWQPWKYRWNGCAVVCFHWLNFAIGFGIWEKR